jgi:3,4-dihydroxy-2-butanone 4-phosphate synthase
MPVELQGQHSGISAEERAQTIRALIDPRISINQISYPGHLILLGAANGGLKERKGHTESAVELARLAGLYPGAVICEVMSTDGEMKRGEDLLSFATVLGIPVIDIEDLTST